MSNLERPNRDDAGSDADEYPLAPLPETFEKASSPAYRSHAATPNVDPYAVGDEVDDANFAVEPASPPLDRSIARSVLRRQTERADAESRGKRIAATEDPTRFTLTNMFLLVTLASIAFAAGRFLPRGIFAGVCGGAAFMSLIMARWLGRNGAVFHLAWWMLFGIYLLVSVLATLGV
jgi:hypothetical protein